jgi:hypothetical protein
MQPIREELALLRDEFRHPIDGEEIPSKDISPIWNAKASNYGLKV